MNTLSKSPCASSLTSLTTFYLLLSLFSINEGSQTQRFCITCQGHRVSVAEPGFEQRLYQVHVSHRLVLCGAKNSLVRKRNDSLYIPGQVEFTTFISVSSFQGPQQALYWSPTSFQYKFHLLLNECLFFCTAAQHF